jgi:hypothetical protein
MRTEMSADLSIGSETVCSWIDSQASKMVFRKITRRDRPEDIASMASRLDAHLKEALMIARRRAWRSSPLVRQLLETATVEGLAFAGK